MKTLKAAVCMFVHHRGWCKSLHKEPKESWKKGCPFVDAAMLALYPPIIIGKLEKAQIDQKTMEALSVPGSVIKC